MLRVRIRLGRVSVDAAVQSPGESGEYRLARNRLLEAEIELRRMVERVAAQRRALPPGGAVPDDYFFEKPADGGGEVRFSQLLAPGKDTLVIYSFMFLRWPGDTRPGPAEGQTARLPLAETPCHRVPRSSTRSTVLLTSPTGSASSWWRSQIRPELGVPSTRPQSCAVWAVFTDLNHASLDKL